MNMIRTLSTALLAVGVLTLAACGSSPQVAPQDEARAPAAETPPAASTEPATQESAAPAQGQGPNVMQAQRQEVADAVATGDAETAVTAAESLYASGKARCETVPEGSRQHCLRVAQERYEKTLEEAEKLLQEAH